MDGNSEVAERRGHLDTYPKVGRGDPGPGRLADLTGTELVVEARVPAARSAPPTCGGPTAGVPCSPPEPPGRTARRTRRAHGLPAPALRADRGRRRRFVIVQELLPGAPPAVVGRFPWSRRCSTSTAGWPACWPALRRTRACRCICDQSGPGFCLHDTLAGYDRRYRQAPRLGPRGRRRTGHRRRRRSGARGLPPGQRAGRRRADHRPGRLGRRRARRPVPGPRHPAVRPGTAGTGADPGGSTIC